MAMESTYLSNGEAPLIKMFLIKTSRSVHMNRETLESKLYRRHI